MSFSFLLVLSFSLTGEIFCLTSRQSSRVHRFAHSLLSPHFTLMQYMTYFTSLTVFVFRVFGLSFDHDRMPSLFFSWVCTRPSLFDKAGAITPRFRGGILSAAFFEFLRKPFYVLWAKLYICKNDKM